MKRVVQALYRRKTRSGRRRKVGVRTSLRRQELRLAGNVSIFGNVTFWETDALAIGFGNVSF